MAAKRSVKPFLKQVERWNMELAHIGGLKDLAARRTMSDEVWRPKAMELAATIADERRDFREVASELPPDVASQYPVRNLETAIDRASMQLAQLISNS